MCGIGSWSLPSRSRAAWCVSHSQPQYYLQAVILRSLPSAQAPPTTASAAGLLLFLLKKRYWTCSAPLGQSSLKPSSSFSPLLRCDYWRSGVVCLLTASLVDNVLPWWYSVEVSCPLNLHRYNTSMAGETSHQGSHFLVNLTLLWALNLRRSPICLECRTAKVAPAIDDPQQTGGIALLIAAILYLIFHIQIIQLFSKI